MKNLSATRLFEENPKVNTETQRYPTNIKKKATQRIKLCRTCTLKEMQNLTTMNIHRQNAKTKAKKKLEQIKCTKCHLLVL